MRGSEVAAQGGRGEDRNALAPKIPVMHARWTGWPADAIKYRTGVSTQQHSDICTSISRYVTCHTECCVLAWAGARAASALFIACRCNSAWTRQNMHVSPLAVRIGHVQKQSAAQIRKKQRRTQGVAAEHEDIADVTTSMEGQTVQSLGSSDCVHTLMQTLLQ